MTNYLDINAGNQQIQIIANDTSTIYDATQLYVDDSSLHVRRVRHVGVAGRAARADTVSNTPEDGEFSHPRHECRVLERSVSTST